MDRKLRVFLCHASQDKPVVRDLYQRLNAEGWIDPWLDEEKLLPGQDWDLEIEKAVEDADAVIVCLSNNSVTKEGYVQKELRFVLNIADEKPEGAIFVIPIRLDDCPVPRRLRNWQYVDYFPSGRRDLAYQRLVIALDIPKKKLEEQQEKYKHKISTESNPAETAREEKMRIQREMYEKGYANGPSRRKTGEASTLIANNNNGNLNNYAGYLLVDQKEKLNQLLAIKSKKFIWEDADDKNSIQSELVGSISHWTRVSISLLFVLLFFPGTFYVFFLNSTNSIPLLLAILISALLLAVSLLSVAFLYRKLIDSKLDYQIELQEEKIRKLTG